MIAERGQIDGRDAILELPGEIEGQAFRQGRLADSARAGQRQQTHVLPPEQFRELPDLLVPADQLSLGVRINQQLPQYSTPIRRALEAGTLVVCAAGNNANRPGLPGFNPNRPATNGFVEPPANADHSLAVAAVDSEFRIVRFSARSSQLTGVGGKVNIAGPGVAVFSSVPGGHDFFDGTSMATPHVAGIAALWAQSAGLSGMALWNRLVQSALPLNLPSVDVAVGLVQAPQ